MPVKPRRLVTVLIALGLGLLVAACGGGSKSAGDTTTPQSPIAYSKCMRAHGITNFPDPDANGGLTIDGDKLGIEPASPQFKAADKACQSKMPHLSEKDQTEQYQGALKYAQCMRDHGLAKFPDPRKPGSGPYSQKAQGGRPQDPGFDPESSQFKAADQACKKYLPNGGADRQFGTSHGSGG